MDQPYGPPTDIGILVFHRIKYYFLQAGTRSLLKRNDIPKAKKLIKGLCLCNSVTQSDGLRDSKKKFWGSAENAFCYVKWCPKGSIDTFYMAKSLKGNTEKKVKILPFWRDKPPLIFEIKGSLPWNVVFFLTVLGTFWKRFFSAWNTNIPRSMVGPWSVHGPSMVGAW